RSSRSRARRRPRRRRGMSELFEITPAPGRGRAKLARIRGRLDAKGAQGLLHHTSSVLAGGETLVLNLADVSFIGSSGIGSLLIIVEQFREQGCGVRFVQVPPAVSSVVKVVNLGQFLPSQVTEAG